MGVRPRGEGVSRDLQNAEGDGTVDKTLTAPAVCHPTLEEALQQDFYRGTHRSMSPRVMVGAVVLLALAGIWWLNERRWADIQAEIRAQELGTSRLTLVSTGTYRLPQELNAVGPREIELRLSEAPRVLVTCDSRDAEEFEPAREESLKFQASHRFAYKIWGSEHTDVKAEIIVDGEPVDSRTGSIRYQPMTLELLLGPEVAPDGNHRDALSPSER